MFKHFKVTHFISLPWALYFQSFTCNLFYLCNSLKWSKYFKKFFLLLIFLFFFLRVFLFVCLFFLMLWLTVLYSQLPRCCYSSDCCCCSSHVQLCVIPSSIAHLASLSMGFFRQEYWSGLPCPPPGDLVDPGIDRMSLCLLHWQADSLPHLFKPLVTAELYLNQLLASAIYIHSYSSRNWA